MRAVLAAVALTATGLAGCATDPGPATTAATGNDGPTGTVVVLAAASLTEPFTRLASEVEATNPGLTVVLSFAGSSALAQQALAGAPADVLVTASEATMEPVLAADVVAGEPVVVATNELTIAVPPGNPGHVRGAGDLADGDLAVALCAPQVPCGALARDVLAADGVAAAPDTLEQDVKAVLAKVRLGEVDAGVVYRSDVVAAGDAVEHVDLPAGGVAPTRYPMAVLAGAPNPDGAEAFAGAVRSMQGREALSAAGFGPADAVP